VTLSFGVFETSEATKLTAQPHVSEHLNFEYGSYEEGSLGPM